MIRIESVTIEDFRGIRTLALDLAGRNFAVCGPNGTGKSGIVDAIEFGLTGNVSRLSGEGRGDISVHRHGPHVDCRDAPEKAKVSLKVAIPSIDMVVTVERSVKCANLPILTPNDPRAREILRVIEDHPEFVLSRRELIRYVLATPGKRDEEVRAVLHLDRVERVRVFLQRIANTAKKGVEASSTNEKDSKGQLLSALGIPSLAKAHFLDAVNVHRKVLALPPFDEFTPDTPFKDGLATLNRKEAPLVNKAHATSVLKDVTDTMSCIRSEGTTERLSKAQLQLNALSTNPLITLALHHEQLYTTGLALVDTNACPLCDTAWDPDQLRQHLKEKLRQLKEASQRRKATETLLEPVIALFERAKEVFRGMESTLKQFKGRIAGTEITSFINSCVTAADALRALIPLGPAIDALGTFVIPRAVDDAIAQFSNAVSQLPEPSKQEEAAAWLTIAQERYDRWRNCKRNQEAAKAHADLAGKVSEAYTRASDRVLSGLYAAVQQEFATMYSFINRGDEDAFQAKLTPSKGKLGFDVDFYNRGYFPPGAYHSEGHQDSMGICLYLALMRHLSGKHFTLAVLDDVLMSVDASHRREVCALLKKNFPDTQFIITTHDPIWLRHMRTEGLIEGKAGIQFRRWDVDNGPMQWDNRDVWHEIYDCLKEEDVRSAAGLLRHYLEYIAAELCHRLRAPVEFRGDAQYQLGEMMPAAIAQMKKLLKEGKEAANSFGRKEIVLHIEQQRLKLSAAVETSQAEQWQTNATIHFNHWENLCRADFEPVVKAFQVLLAHFACQECSTFVRVSPEREERESVRCECGYWNINLRRKSR